MGKIISLIKIMKFALVALVAAATAIRRDPGPPYQPGQSGMLGGGTYERVTPARFSADSDDIFMRSVIQNYAQEGSWKDGEPTGVFTLSESSARALAQEVLATHKNITGAAQQEYLNTYWAKAWGHFDVNRTGNIPVLYAPQLMRFLMSDQYISL